MPNAPVSKCTIPNIDCANVTDAIQSASVQKSDLSAHRSRAERGWAWSHSVLCYRRRLWVSEWKWNGRHVDARLLLSEWLRTNRSGKRGSAKAMRLILAAMLAVTPPSVVSDGGPGLALSPGNPQDTSGGEDYTVIRLQGHREGVREKFTTAEYRVSCSWLNFIHQGVYWMGRQPWAGSGKGCWWAGWTGRRQGWGGEKRSGVIGWGMRMFRMWRVCCGSCSDISVFYRSRSKLNKDINVLVRFFRECVFWTRPYLKEGVWYQNNKIF